MLRNTFYSLTRLSLSAADCCIPNRILEPRHKGTGALGVKSHAGTLPMFN